VNKPREELRADGSRWIGDGPNPTYIVFTASGNVMLEMEGEKPEHRALRKNFYQEITVGGVTLTVGDFSHGYKGVPSYSESLANLMHAIIHEVRDEEELQKVSKQLTSVVVAAHRRANENIGRNDHGRFRNFVMHLAKQFGRAPTRSEIREAFYSKGDARKITKLCDANGLSWLPRGASGRPKIVA
jgi:hypothetical protein